MHSYLHLSIVIFHRKIHLLPLRASNNERAPYHLSMWRREKTALFPKRQAKKCRLSACKKGFRIFSPFFRFERWLFFFRRKNAPPMVSVLVSELFSIRGAHPLEKDPGDYIKSS
ncbi:hypothetical protein GCWU000341_01704 [Oribacterium sp. oral taxon 078 str. F0262]|nr:hypothetical protein GCWU000341_01704 [Oribacterium sp. oral taxon 078 str. F0262]